MFYQEALIIFFIVQHNPDGSLMINYSAFAVKSYVISAVEASVPENIAQLQSLIRGLFVF